jgi:hypothetical protein
MNTSSWFKVAAFAAVLGSTAIAPEAQANNCGSAATIAVKLYEKWGAKLKEFKCPVTKDCLDDAGKKERIFREMIAFWNENAGNSWAKIGPRRLEPNQKLEGTIQLAGERLFMTPGPTDADVIEVTINKEDGKAAAVATLSTLDENGRCATGDRAVFDDADKPQERKLKIKNARGKIVVLKIDAGNLTKKFEYRLRARFENGG